MQNFSTRHKKEYPVTHPDFTLREFLNGMLHVYRFCLGGGFSNV